MILLEFCGLGLFVEANMILRFKNNIVNCHCSVKYKL